MKREEYLELNQARLRLALREKGYDRDPLDCMKKMRADGWEFSLQFINGKWSMVVFGRNIRNFEAFDEADDAVYFTVLGLEDKK